MATSSANPKIRSAGILRLLLFWLAWFGPVVALAVANESFLLRLMGVTNISWQVLENPSNVILCGFIAWASLWLAFLTAQALWPVLLLVLAKHEKERSPKRIIQTGERFRKVDLSSPQIVVLQERWSIWQNRIWGFFFFPSPFGATLPISAAISQDFTPEEYNAWISRQVVESRFYRFSSPGILWWHLALCGVVLGQLLQSTSLPQGFGAGAGLTFATVLWFFLRQRRTFAMDAKAVHDFQLEPDFLLATLKKADTLVPHWNWWQVSWERRATALQAPPELRSWMTVALPASFWVLAVVSSWMMVPAKALHGVPVAVNVATPDLTKGFAINTAVMNGDLRGIIQSLSAGNSVHQNDPAFGGATPLLLALRQGDLEMTYMLLSLGSSLLTEQDSAGRGALFYAALAPNRLQVVSYVLSGKVQVDQVDRSGLSVLQMAKNNGWTDIVPLLEKSHPRTTNWLRRVCDPGLNHTEYKIISLSMRGRKTMSQKTLFDFTVPSAKNENLALKQYEGKVVLVVNVASQCGFTPQYDGLEELYNEYKDKGLMILGFPCNQFGAQEPGSNEQIQEYCRMNHGVSFPVLGKVDVNGNQALEVYQWLKASAPGVLGTEAIKWNFTKFFGWSQWTGDPKIRTTNST